MSEPPATEQPVEIVAKTTSQAKRLGCSPAIRLVIGLTLAGMFGGCLLGMLVNTLPKEAWSQLDLGQDRAIRIIGTDDDSNHSDTRYMYLGTASGDVYRCWLDVGDETEKRCNKATTEQVSNVRYECPSSMKMATPQPPGEIIDSLCYPMYHRSGDESHIVILRDGSVWEWMYEFREFDLSGLSAPLVGSLAGLIVGFIAGIFAAVFWMIRRNRSDRRKIQSEL